LFDTNIPKNPFTSLNCEGVKDDGGVFVKQQSAKNPNVDKSGGVQVNQTMTLMMSICM
jgi:hypothetical protein